MDSERLYGDLLNTYLLPVSTNTALPLLTDAWSTSDGGEHRCSNICLLTYEPSLFRWGFQGCCDYSSNTASVCRRTSSYRLPSICVCRKKPGSDQSCQPLALSASSFVGDHHPPTSYIGGSVCMCAMALVSPAQVRQLR
jgi:hypothetical protein